MSTDTREQIVTRLREDLLGPIDEGEILNGYPTDVYMTGILFPQRSEVAEEDRDQLQAEGRVDFNGGNDAAEEVSLAATKRPASIGISFVVESSEDPQIQIRFCAARYRKAESEAETEPERSSWIREVLFWEESVSLNFEYRDFSPDETEIDGLSAYVRTSPWGERLLVTVAMVNSSTLEEGYERDQYEERCFLQTRISVAPRAGTVLCARPLGGSAIDEDTRMARLIYRDVREYAVGHTCSAEWTEDSGVLTSVASTWIPQARVRSMSSAGVEEFEELGREESGPVLSTEFLSEQSGSTLIEGLKRVPATYLEWLESQEARLDSLDEELRDQALLHLENARSTASRMESSIQLIKSDPDVETAFRLANRAIMVQWQWGKPKLGPLVWRPFQLGFILLALKSLANEDHKDRDVADLLWFPTGGGKTEAYLALIAFTLFLRRLRYGNEGSGVCCFMRYTLRLLTVQQFQRACALVCACDSIRYGDYVPRDIAVDLGQTPFSIGLWVGGDATPNNFVKAEEALNNENAHNRPDQLTRCPHHGTRLNWRADSGTERVFATCEEKDCHWHENPVPVWTVDTDVYRVQPSLVIGTVDKFAQLARNASTRSLFGGGNIRRPDLIIQDELHLISGPLGTLAGIYEVAIDQICSQDGGSRPKIVASTATIRQADSQIRSLFDRRTCLFPPPVLDASNSGFAFETDDEPGRIYLGVTTAGRSSKFALQAAAATLAQSATSLPVSERDDFWTLVSYFNSLRELGGALVLMQDDVGDSIGNYAERRSEQPRSLNEPMELTSRVSSSDLKHYLDQLDKRFDETGSCDVVLASNMISVGVDVSRLGMMLVNGQPKGIAEYIQATSRVGRRRGGPGGLIITLYNNAKARDRSHFESFRTWHSALYRDVEATSVTPFATTARDKALHAALVILARHLIDDLSQGVDRVNDHVSELEDFVEDIIERAEHVDPAEAGAVEEELQDFLEMWRSNAGVFKRYWNDRGPRKSLLISAEKAAEIKSRFGAYPYRAVPTPNSMRSVEPGSLFKLEERLRNE